MVKMKLLPKQFTSKTRFNKWIKKKIQETYDKLSQDQDFIKKIDEELDPYTTKEEIHTYLSNLHTK